MSHERVVWWVKRDARLVDNEALTQACNESREVLPLCIFEPSVLKGPDWSEIHSFALQQSITSLRKNLEHHGSNLWVRKGHALTVLEALHLQYPFTAIYAHREVGLQHTFARDKAVATWCQARHIAFIELSQNGVWRGMKNRNDWQKQFQAVLDTPTLPIPARLKDSKPVGTISVGTTPTLRTLGVTRILPALPVVGERAAHDTLRSFLRVRGSSYSGGISSMLTAPTACSRLSVHFAWGTLTLRQAWQATQNRLTELDPAYDARWRRSLPKFQSRLYWHAHFVQKLEDEVGLEFSPANQVFATSLPVVTGHECVARLMAWKTGMTGFPAVDAAMRYYATNGWLNFRSRAMITSFAVHALRIPWQTIQYELAKFMIDYVPGINTTQVQMQTGVTGINTIRVYSPMKQQTDHDPEARFIKSQIPELAQFSAAEISAFQSSELGTYPKPIIDFKTETKIMKDVLYALKKSPVGRVVSQKVYVKHGSRAKRTSK